MNIFQNTSKEVANNTNKGDIMNVYDLLKGTRVLEFGIPAKQLDRLIGANYASLHDSYGYIEKENPVPLEEGAKKVYPVYTVKVQEKIYFSDTSEDCSEDQYMSNGRNTSNRILDSTHLSYDSNTENRKLADKHMSVMDICEDAEATPVYLLVSTYKKVIILEDDMYYQYKGEKRLAKSGNFLVLNDLEKMEGYEVDQRNSELYDYLEGIIDEKR